MGRPKKQQEIPGTERVERPEIQEPAEDLRAITGEIATLNERKRNAQRTLIEACAAAGITVHKYLDDEGNERTVRITETPKVKIERAKAQKSSSEDDDIPPPTEEDVTVQ
jgi:hypothetical protein